MPAAPQRHTPTYWRNLLGDTPETLAQVRARRGTIALSHQVIDLVAGRGRQPSPEATFALIEEFFDAGDATQEPSSDGSASSDDLPPAPAILNERGGPKVAPAFVEWLMGLPNGWVTDPDLGLTQVQQLTALGNGALPQQAVCAMRLLAQPGIDSPCTA